jgi:hypothetical protein
MAEESYEILLKPAAQARMREAWTVASRHACRIEAERQFTALRDRDHGWSQLMLVLSRWDAAEQAFREQVLRRARQGEAERPAPLQAPKAERAKAPPAGEWKTRAEATLLPSRPVTYARPVVAVVGLLGVLVLLFLR